MNHKYQIGDRWKISYDNSWFQITDVIDNEIHYITSEGFEDHCHWSAFEYWMIGIDRDTADEIAKFVGNFPNEVLTIPLNKSQTCLN